MTALWYKKHIKETIDDKQTDNIILTGRCEDNYGCRLSAFRKNSSVKIWENNIKIDNCMGISAIGNNLLFVGRQGAENNTSTYNLFNFNINYFNY